MSQIRNTLHKYLAVLTLLVGMSFGYIIAQQNSTQFHNTSGGAAAQTQPIGCPMGQSGTCP